MEKHFQSSRTLIVKKIVIPPPLHELGNKYGDRVVWVLALHLQYISKNRSCNQPIPRVQDHQFGWLETSFARGFFDVAYSDC
jgi:hypothetical protein